MSPCGEVTELLCLAISVSFGNFFPPFKNLQMIHHINYKIQMLYSLIFVIGLCGVGGTKRHAGNQM